MHRRTSLTLVGSAVLLASCAASVAVPAAPNSTDPACAQALVSIRGADDLDGHARREVGSQATAAWGDDGAIELRCGLDSLAPSTDPCQSLGGVDWVVTQVDGRTIFTAYGRTPTLSVSVAGNSPTGTDVILDTLAPAAAALPKNGRECL